MAKHAIVRTDKLAGTQVNTKLISVKYIVTKTSGSGESVTSTSTETAIDNGNLLSAKALMDGEREVYKGEAPATATKLGELVLVASPEVMYDERLKDLADFENEAGKAARAYVLTSGDIFSVTKEAIEGSTTPAVGDVASVTNGKTTITVSASGTGFGRVIAVDVVGRNTFYAIQVD